LDDSKEVGPGLIYRDADTTEKLHIDTIYVDTNGETTTTLYRIAVVI